MKYLKSIVFLLSIISFFTTNHLYAGGNKTLLWELSGNGLSKPSYIFGTIHLACPEDVNIQGKIGESLKKSEQLVLELDMDEPNFMAKMQQATINDSMKNISGELSLKDKAILDSFFVKHYQANMTQLGILKPFALLSMMFIKGLDCPQPGSYEMSLMSVARTNKWEVLGLEELNDQLSIFDDIPVKEQLSWIVKYAEDESEFRNTVSELVAAYKSQDLEKLANLVNESPEYKDLSASLLDDRNAKWISKIEELAKSKSTFFAVGAAHLGSKKGILELLKKQGYTLKPIH